MSVTAKPRLLRIGVLIALLVTAGCGQVETDVTAPATAQLGKQWTVVDEYCVECHNDIDLAGGFAFDAMAAQSLGANADVWEKATRKLRGRLMPPPNRPQPSEATLRSLVATVESALDDAASANPSYEGVGLHRLNRKEYANAVRDLLALEIDPVTLLPQDEVAQGFDNIASALQVSPSFVEAYVIAARLVALQAVGRPDARAGSQTYAATPGSQHSHVEGLPLGTRGGVLGEHYFASDGEYEVNVADVIGGLWGNDMEFENTLVVTLDGKLVYETVVGGEEDMKRFDQIHNGALDAINVRLKNIRFAATAGPHRVGVAFRHRTFAESDDRRQMFLPGGGQDRVFRVSSFQISGPFEPSGLSATPSRERIFECHPERGDQQQRCAEQILTSIGTRAFRRPLSETDLTELLQYYERGAASGGFEAGIRSGITAILANTNFLYRGEQIPPNLTAGELYRIDDLELASKLSFFLWNSIPDDELLDLAVRRELHKSDVLGAQIARMLADKRAETLGSNFVYQWLDMVRLEEVEPDRAVFPYASGSGDPRGDFSTELTLFANSIFAEDRSVVDLLTADHTYVNERVALLYDIKSVKGDSFQRVTLEHSARRGLLGKGAVLMAAAYPNRTSPVLRGAFILKHLTGTPPAAPPAEVPALVEQETTAANFLTVREQMAAHSTAPECFSCHGVMDPLGFALENFDAVGAWRERDRFAGASPLDVTGRLPDGAEIKGPDDLREALASRPEQFVQTFVEGLFTYALGRTLDYRDMPTVRRIVRETARNDYRFSSIVEAIVSSDQFQVRRVPESATGPVTARNVPGQ